VVSQHSGAFTCDVSAEGDAATVSPRGELDMATAGALDQELRRLHDSGVDKILLDLGGLTFMDSSGLHLIVRWAGEAGRNGFEFELGPGPPAVQRIFNLTALEDTLPFRRKD
jgi:anti-sigma B factor antagonist